MNQKSLWYPTLLVAIFASCGPAEPTVPTTAFTGATVWDGTGSDPVANATIVVQEGRVLSLAAGGEPPAGATVVNLGGRYVTPGFINVHGHVSGIWGPDGVTDEMARVRADLDLFARYGITTVNSLGDEGPVLAARNESTPLDVRARLFASGPVITDIDPDAARVSAMAIANEGVDWLKLRVDDNLGTSEKMPWTAVEAVLDVANEQGLRLATHLFYLEDAKRLLEMGTGMVAHSVRDTPVDSAFLSQLRKSGVCYVPTLTREVSTYVYGKRPDFFDDPFFTKHAHAGQLARVSDPEFMARTAASPAAAGYRTALVQAMANVKTISDAGLPVGMGTDSGPAGRFPGYFEHMELWMMVDAGMTPEEVLLSATSVAASCLAEDDIGTLAAGNWADFIVFEDDPLADIRATRSLESVYIAGRIVR